MSDETRELVRKTAHEMGYPLERLRARYPQLQRVAVFCPAGRDALYYGTALEVIRLLGQQGSSVLVSMEHDSGQARVTVADLARRREVDAAVLVGSRITEDELPGDLLPYVVVGEVPDGADVWRVGVDNEAGGRAVGEHLWSLGHRCIGWVGVNSNPLIDGQRLGGLRSVWSHHGHEFPDGWVLRLDDQPEDHLPATLPSWLDEMEAAGHEPTALAFYNDVLAAAALKALSNLGSRVPEDVSIVGFDDATFSVWLNPALTTVRQPFDQMGALAAQLLQEQVAVRDQPAREHVLPCQLIPRETTAERSPPVGLRLQPNRGSTQVGGSRTENHDALPAHR